MALAKLDFLRTVAWLFYPPACAACSASVATDKYLCDECDARAPRIARPFCAKCSEPFDGAITNVFECANCAHRTLHFETAVAVYRSRGIVRNIVLDFKYGRQMHLRHLVGRGLIAALDDERLHGLKFDLLVPVPLHPARERERGFNQAALLAELLCAWKICVARFVYEERRTCEICGCF